MKLIYLAFILSVLFACKKSEEPISCPVIEQNHSNSEKVSKDYIQAYPGSVWFFNNLSDLECYGPTPTKTYTPDGMENGCKRIIEDKILTPDHEIFGVFDGKFQLENDSEKNITYRMPFYDTSLGTFYERTSYHMGDEPGYIKDYERSVIGIEDSIVLGENTYYDIIKVKHSITTTLSNGNVLNDVKFYTLAKDVGMVRYEYPKENEDVYCIGFYIAD